MRPGLGITVSRPLSYGVVRFSRASGVFVIGYGTLLYRASVERTIGRPVGGAREMLPVRVHGFRRLFNMRPGHYDASDLWGRPDVENGAMNVEPAAAELFNGLALRVGPEELGRLDRRESDYERLRVEARDFETGEPLGTGHVYSSRPDAPWIECDPERLLPLWRDVVWARAGAYGISRQFGEAFDRTTYLADGRTLVADRYRDHLSPGEPPRAEDLARAAGS